MPSIVTRYVNTNSTAGGNGTTSATTGANRAYVRLSEALSAEFTSTPNLITSDIVLKIVCSGTAIDDSGTNPVTALQFPAFSTDETRYVHIVADTGSRATATWDTGKYILTTDGGNASSVVVLNSVKVTKWEGLQIENRSTNGVWNVLLNSSVLQDTIITVDGCYLRSISGSGNNGDGIQFIGGVRKAQRVSNTIVHGNFQTGLGINFAVAGSSGSYFYNNTVIGNFTFTGINVTNSGTNVTCSVKNNLISGSGTNYTLDNSGQTLTATNISSDATSPQTTLRNINSTAFFISTASGDFRTTGNAATAAGTDLSTDSIYAFSTDINGTNRSAYSSWDIGAYELPVNTAIVNTSAGWVNPIQFTDIAGGTVTEWYTYPVEAVTLSGMAVGNVRIAESNTAANLTARLEIAVTDDDGSNPVIWGAASAPVGVDVVETVTPIYVAGPDISVTQGQRLRFRVYIDDFEAAMGTGYTSVLYYNGATASAAGDTYVTLPVTLTEIVGPAAPPGAVFTVNQIGFGNLFAVSNDATLGTVVNIVRA